MRYALLTFLVVLLATPVWGMEVEGVSVPEQVRVDDQLLILNGAGVRTKLFFDIYVGALYLPKSATTADQVLNRSGPRRLTISFLYDEVSREKLVDGWVDGFEKNRSSDSMAKLKTRLDLFNALFSDARKGDLYVFDFLDDGSTVVTLNGSQTGVVSGADFQRALLQVWLGKKPADKGLKEALLQGLN